MAFIPVQGAQRAGYFHFLLSFNSWYVHALCPLLSCCYLVDWVGQNPDVNVFALSLRCFIRDVVKFILCQLECCCSVWFALCVSAYQEMSGIWSSKIMGNLGLWSPTCSGVILIWIAVIYILIDWVVHRWLFETALGVRMWQWFCGYDSGCLTKFWWIQISFSVGQPAVVDNQAVERGPCAKRVSDGTIGEERSQDSLRVEWLMIIERLHLNSTIPTCQKCAGKHIMTFLFLL